MNKWTKAFLVCLGLLAIASRADESFQSPLQSIASKSSSIEITKTSYEQLAFDAQANKPRDLDLVRKIRKELTLDRNLSTNGKNVKIIIVDKEITLKGPVKSDGEKTRILNIISKLSSDHTIRNQLEVARNNY
ncbi:MAG: BON domain-containing protein [Bacteriovorax sp.]|nr:BON domain-containing protein [Bacteriovorax sp.]